MIVKHPDLDSPHGNTVIWRYMGLDKFLDLLISETLYFTNAARMSDRYEGLLPRRNQKAMLNALIAGGMSEEKARLVQERRMKEARALKELTLLNCWTINKSESYALWKIYLGGAKAGVAIRTTVGKLTRAIKAGKDPFREDMYLGRVSYTDFIQEASENRFHVITTKNTFYEYEQELRLFIFHYPETILETIPPYDVKHGRRVKVALPELIDELYLSPFIGPWFESALSEILKKVRPELRDRIRNSEILDQ